ncbi:uncharacterized protein UDID_17051 [Ustilago sp. UG-2017a]|nr:uncharacterized protein UDID_17051 [Ustilago sp. UG-2017a]
MTRRHGYIPLHSIASDTAPALSLQRVPSSSSTVQGGPSSTTPVLLSCVDSFDTAPPPCYPACLAPLCLLSGVDSFDTAPPPQDLLAGLLYTAPPPLTVTLLLLSIQAHDTEFIAATEATREVLFLKQLLRSIGIATGTPTVYSDNTGCIQVSKDPAQHWKLKHIDTKYHFVCNNVQEGRVQIKYVDTTRNLADVLTKPIGRQAMQQARSGLHLQTLAVVYETGSPSYATVLKNGGHTLKQQHNEQGTYTVEGGS